jgi:hypothetical protein
MTNLKRHRERIRTFFRDRVPNDILEVRFARPERAAELGFPKSYPAPLSDGFGTLALDLTINDETGELVCHEMNGSNYQGIVALTGVSDDRCRNEVAQTLRYARRRGFVNRGSKVLEPMTVLFAHQPSAQMRTGSEFYERVVVFRHLLEAAVPGAKIASRRAGRRLGNEDIAIVWGDVRAVVTQLSIQKGRFYYNGRPVVMAAYPFILAEAVRQGNLPAEILHASALAGVVDVDIFHGGRMLALCWQKGVQQDLLNGTGITPLPYFEACSEDAAVERTVRALSAGAVVLKPNATSGGVGVELIAPGMGTVEIRDTISRMRAACLRKYGGNADTVLYPVRGFRFVRSRGFALDDGLHAWDLRVAVMVWSGSLQVGPLTIRLAPVPFDPATFYRDRDQWVSNCSGRDTLFVRSPFDRMAMAAGLDEDMLYRMCDAVSRFALRAIDWSWKQGVGKTGTHEDRCDTEGRWPYGRSA